jgi:DNA-damage-inducible protein D
MEEKTLIVFKGKNIRRIWHENEWWFSVVDVVGALTDSANARDYWSKMKIRVKSEDGFELSTICLQLKLKSTDGKMYATDCANTETLFRIIQSIPSPKAEPFKRWLAKVGYERVQEIEDPELATKRTAALYRAKGYPDSWIALRMRGMAVHDTLVDEWDKRGIKEDKEFAILTAEIANATFGMKPREHKEHKGLQKENLRDHMSDLELIFSMLGEASTTEIAKSQDAQGFEENKKVAQRGGKIAGDARKQLELQTGNKVVTKDNFLALTQTKKLGSK